jgi:tripeptide aminopeptidase
MINHNRLFNTFMELCAIDSEPTRERLMADQLTERLTSLDFVVSEDDTGKKIGGSAGNLYARLNGTTAGEALLFSCHMDRAVPGVNVKPRIDGDYIVSDGTTVLGADDASGLAALLEGITVLKQTGKAHPTIELVLTVAEELSLVGSKHFDTTQVTSRIGFVLDAGGDVGEIVLQAPEHIKFTAVFHGLAAHAGFAPEQGISAIQIAAKAISRMELLRIDTETTANIGSISAIGPTNIIQDRCELQGEVRSLVPVKVQSHMAALSGIMYAAATEYGGSVTIETETSYQAYQLREDSEPVRRAARAAAAMVVPVRYKATGGGSDANFFNSRGLPTVVLSCGYEKVHTTAERIPLKQLVLLTEWVLAIIETWVL